MRVLWPVLLLPMLVAGYVLALLSCCDGPAGDRPPAVLPLPAPLPLPIDVIHPVRNYMSGPRWHQNGSCLHAAVQDLLRWQGLDATADYWRAHFGGPADLEDVMRIADSLGLKHAETDAGDEQFLAYCTAHRLGAAIYWEVDRPGDHAIVFCGFDRDEAVLLGTNRPETTRMPKSEFLRCWRDCGGGAFTILPHSLENVP